jgi:hypothetical protein
MRIVALDPEDGFGGKARLYRLALFVPAFVLPSAIVGGLYYGLAGIRHAMRGGRNFHEHVAMISDLLIFLLFAVYAAHVVFGRSA